MMKPLLSIGIIFKNEIRCLERCLKSLAPLREELPCELVMADTGSGDGSREIAERYADILFDFPWVDDFAAARNAVMDHCSGEWYLTLDADEWLDKDISAFTVFLRNANISEPACGITIRNYTYRIEEGKYTEFLAIRMIRLSAGLRYAGTIHEYLEFPDGRMMLVYPIQGFFLHHDGYICLNDGSEAGREKRRRNRCFLEKELEANPEDLRTLVQCIENCGQDYENQISYIRRGVELVQNRRGGWKKNGANLMRYAVHGAHKLGLPEFEAWLALAEEQFPDSIFTTIEAQFDAAEHAWFDADYPEVIRRGQRYLKAVREYREGNFNLDDSLRSPLLRGSLYDENTLRIFIARAQIYENQPEMARETLEALSFDSMDEAQTMELQKTLLCLHTLSDLDTKPLLLRFWAELNVPGPSQETADRRRVNFVLGASAVFAQDYIRSETARMNGETVPDEDGSMRPEEWNVPSKLRPCRYGYTLFKPLLGETELGAAAVLMDEEKAETAARLLSEVKDLDMLPIGALARALLRGAAFPDRPLQIEEMDALAARLTQDKASLRTLAERTASVDFSGNWPALLWTRGLVLAAVKTCEWKDEERDMALARMFAKVERAFLTAYYAPEILREENVFALPVMHRSGWYCARAFDALEAGDAAGYVRHLRKGLASCPEMKPMAEFLAKHTPELQPPPPSPELLALAEQVRTMLAAYDPNDPAVSAIKASPVYQRVAYLIEGGGV